MLRYIDSFRHKYKPMPIGVKSNFKAMEKLNGIEDLDSIRAIIIKANIESYQHYMRCFQQQNTKITKMEFFLKLRFFSELNSKTGILEDFLIEDDKYGKIVTTDRSVINEQIISKYTELFRGEKGKLVIIPSMEARFIHTLWMM